MKYLLIILIILIILKKKVEKFETKPYIWTYWENLPGKKKPEYIDLCFESMKKHCSKSFNIVILNENSIKNYLPNINPNIKNIKKEEIFKLVDYYRLLLLYKYGGIWLDADTIVFKNLISLIHKLDKDNLSYIGFGCSSGTNKFKCRSITPSNGVMVAKKIVK